MKYKIKSAFKQLATTAITLSGVATAACVTLSAQSAQALNFTLAPSSFTVSTANGSTGDNNASSGIPINQNTTTGGSGFGGTFGSSFLLLGAKTTDSSIPLDSDNSANSLANSTPFVVTSTDATQGIQLNFNWAFQGNATGKAGDADSFIIQLVEASNPGNTIPFFQESLSYNTTSKLTSGYGSQTNATATVDSANDGLVAGTYYLQIILNENTNAKSSAAGFNNIKLSTVTAPVPFEFSTNLGLVAFGCAFYGFNQLKKKKAVKNLQA